MDCKKEHPECLQDEGTDPPPLPGNLAEINQPSIMIPFWLSYDSWFQTHGILLYPLSRRWFPPEDQPQDPVLPFAHCLSWKGEKILGLGLQTRFGYGQDFSGRDVFIKIIEKGSTEHAINSYLLENGDLFQGDQFPSVLPPVAVLDSPHGFSFLVMPLWNSSIQIRHNFVTVRDVMKLVRCLLAGLTFLHDHKIAHRDINHTNVLMNCYSPALDDYWARDMLRDHIQTSGHVEYALFDFNLSVQFPADADIRTVRLPSCEAWRGALMFHPTDAIMGQPEYNPFPFDVACLGNLLLYHFATIVPVVPPLAPLFARMTTHVIDQRFTASEALVFYDEHLAHLSEVVLETGIVAEPSFEPLNYPDLYWKQLGTGDRERWSQYRDIMFAHVLGRSPYAGNGRHTSIVQRRRAVNRARARLPHRPALLYANTLFRDRGGSSWA
ncbi:hypothetical protein VTO73DRAFT_6610 [Trametes versicolor]